MINIGNIDFASGDKIIEIRDKGQIIKAKYVIDSKDIHKYDLMGEHYIEITFDLDVVVPFSRTDYIIWEGTKFTLRKDYKPTQQNSQRYTYILKFEAPEMLLQDAEMFYTRQDLKEGEWSLTSGAASFIKIAVDNANRYFNTTDWKVGTIEPTTIQFITFNSSNVFNALTQIAETFKAEWHITGNTIHLINKQQLGSEIEFENEVSVSSVSQSEGNTDAGYTRIVALGSTRNIPTNYRATTSGESVDAIYQKRLRIPVSRGNTVDAKPNMSALEAVETTVIFDDVYPKRIGTLSSITTVKCPETNEQTKEVTYWNAYRYKDTGLSFKESYLLPGVELRIVFQSGKLNGLDFAVKFNPDAKPETSPEAQVFEIIRSEDYGKALPNDTLKPENGDKYILHGFDINLVANQYVPTAELELYNKAVEWLAENLKDKFVYTCPTVINHFAKNEMNLEIGQKVKLVKSLGGLRNYIRGSKELTQAVSTNNFTFRVPTLAEPIQSNTQYTLSIGKTEITSGTAVTSFTVLVYNLSTNIQGASTMSFPISTDRKSITFTTGTLPNNGYVLLFYTGTSGASANRAMKWTEVKLEKSDKATNYVFAPEDVSDATRSSRIMGFEKKLINKYDATYTVGDNSAYSRLSSIEKQIDELKYAGQIYQNTGGNNVYLIKQFDQTAPSDFNAYSATASNSRYLNKQTGGTVQEDTTFQKDVKILGKGISDVFQNDTFTSGQFGSGFKMWKAENGQSYAEFDNLMVRREMVVNTLTIAEIKSVGGQILVSPANMYVNKVEEISDSYRCYFDTANGAIANQFAVDDQVICRKFNGASIKYYWCKVLGIGSDHIRISKNDKDGSGIPATGDEIIQFGNRTNIARQSAIMISAYGSDAPSFKQYAGINSYNLTGKEVTVISPSGNKFTGEFIISSSGKSVTTTINDSINNIQLGGSNLVVISGSAQGGYNIPVVGSPLIPMLSTIRIRNRLVPASPQEAYIFSTFNASYQIVIYELDAKQNFIKEHAWLANKYQFTTTSNTAYFGYLFRKSDNGVIALSEISNFKFKLEKGNKASDWSESPEDIQASIGKAQADATNATTAATNAQTSANKANSLLADIANDNILDVSEKQNVLKEWQIIQGEYPTITAQALTYIVASSDYVSKYNSLSSYITPLVANMTVNSVIVGTIFRSTFKAYYDAKIALLKLVTDKAKVLADAAQTSANTAITNAATAQTSANAAQSTANTAKTNAEAANSLLSDIANDNKFDPSEKQSIKKEWDSIVSEYTKNVAQAATFGISITSCQSAYNALSTYITPLLSNLNLTSDIVGTTFRTTFKNYYDARTDLLNTIASKARDLANAAQSSANNAQTTADKAVNAAGNAQSSANTANNLLSDIASDNKLDPSEKQSIRKEWNIIASELSANNTQADVFSIVTEKTTYNSSFQALANYLNNGVTWSTGIPSWISDANLSVTTTIIGATFRTNWKAYYDARTALLNAVAKKAKSLADTAQISANNAITEVSDAKASIEVLKNQIVSKVSQTDFNSLQGRVSTAESNITQQAGQITSTVEKVDKKNAAYKSYTSASTDKPSVPYSKGDLWITFDGIIKQSQNTRLTGSFIDTDWTEPTKYTDDSAAAEAKKYAEGRSYQGGKILYRDIDFSAGQNGLSVYNNSANGNVIIKRIAKPGDCPTSSAYCLEVSDTGIASPGLGGITWQTLTRANARFIARIIAKIPVGYYLSYHSNTIGAGGSQNWITRTSGTGKYEEYISVIQCGTSGTFSTTNFYALNGTVGTVDAPVLWNVALATVYDMTQAEVDYKSLADKAQSDATNAATAATNAQASANNANSLIADIANDNILDVSEKQNVLKEWQIIQGEYPTITAQAMTYGVVSTAYTSAYNALSSYITPLLANITVNSTIVGTTFRSTFKAYYDAKIALLKLVTDKAKTLAAAAQSSADIAQAAATNAANAASAAQSTANTAKTNADAATNRLNDWASDAIISPTEKAALKQQSADIQSEFKDIRSQANKYSLSTSSEWISYNSAYTLAIAALNKYTAATPENIAVSSDYSNIAAYYTQRQLILEKTASSAKSYAETLVNNIQVGGVNLLRNSKRNEISGAYGFASISGIYLEQDETYTFSINGSIDQQALTDGKELRVYLWAQNASGTWTWSTSPATKSLTDTTVSTTFKFPLASTEQLRVSAYLYPGGGSRTGKAKINWYKLEKGNKATDWTEAPEDVQVRIGKAQTDATNAATAANNAQTSADTAKASAKTANDLLLDIANDNKFDPSEKQSTKKEWDAIVSEYSKNTAQATTFGIAITAYQMAYNALNTYITPLLSSLITTSDIIGTTFRSTFKTYYDARLDLLNTIAIKAKALADKAQTAADVAQNTANIGAKRMRYIRDWVNGSNINTGNHWVEIQAIDNQAVNKALSKPVTTNTALTASSCVTDGNTISTSYSGGSTNLLQYVIVDLQAVYEINQIKVWHYYTDARIYYKTKTEISVDGVNWITLFDSDVEGTYKETVDGRTYFVKDYDQNVIAKQLANDAQATANLKNQTFYSDTQPSTPSGGFKMGDLWYKINTVDGCYETYRWNGSTWTIINVNVSKAKQVITDNSITNLVTKTGINALGVGDTLWSKINQTADLISLEIGKVQIGNRNYLQGSRLDNATGWSTSQGNVSVYNDSNFGNTVRYERVSGADNFQKTFTIDKPSLVNTDLVYYVIAKKSSGTFCFGGWSQTVNKLSSNTANQIDLGNGWVQYWVTFKSGTTIGDTVFGLNSITGAWLFYAVGVLKGNKPLDWSEAPEDVQTRISKAQTDATNATTAATNAQSSANTANSLLADIVNDNILDVSEKQNVLKEWQIIQGEYATITAQALTYTVASTDYVSKYNSLSSYLTPLLANLTINSVIVGANFRTNFKNYYDAKIALLKLVTDKAKVLADAAQLSANTAITNAATAQTVANNAQSTANTAKTNADSANTLLSDIANDNKFAPSEKQSTKKEWDAIISEYGKNITQAFTFSVSSTAYTAAYNLLNTYITPLLSNLSATTDIVGTTFRSTFKAYYDTRTDLLNAVSVKAKTLAESAQSTANSKVTADEVKASMLITADGFNFGIDL